MMVRDTVSAVDTAAVNAAAQSSNLCVLVLLTAAAQSLNSRLLCTLILH